MELKYKHIFVLIALSLGGMSTWGQPKVTYRQIVTSPIDSWVEVTDRTKAMNGETQEEASVSNGKGQTIEGFGACFNELGWVSLGLLPSADRESIMKELFLPNYGANFTICRMPIGANDFSRDWYSYNENDGDFKMKNFSIQNDTETLIPFIKSAQLQNADIKVWASPWCPPSWMKHNKHYASAVCDPSLKNTKFDNGLPADRAGREGMDMFILKPEYLKAYALYFSKFIKAYRKAGIDIFGVMPQNEFNSAQIFPSCCWTAQGLASFVGDYLGPEMKKLNVDVMFGTMERANYLLVDTILQDSNAKKYVKAVGFQWAGKDAVKEVRRHYPKMKLMQTEQECGDGHNDWNGMLHSWDLLKHYMDNGISIYNYWNVSLEEGGISRWGWRQNSLVVVNPESRMFRFTYEYYLMKHISHFVLPGAVYRPVEGSAKEILAFENPDGSTVLSYMEKEGKDKTVTVKLKGTSFRFFTKANCLNTIKVD